MLKWAIFPLGLLTALVLAAPQLVVVGLMLLIVPGLILDGKGQVRVRKSLVQHFVPAALFYFGFDGGSSVDGFAGARFTPTGIASNGWWRCG